MQPVRYFLNESRWRMSPTGAERCLLLVHAHPDDESIFTGATMAKYAAEGARTALVTCTLGERGIIPDNYWPAAEKEPTSADAESRLALLAKLRARELDAACAELGVTDHRYLGGPGRWRDSGPRVGDDPRSFVWAALDEAAADLATLIRELQPQVIVTYDSNGFYGHPDHIQAHRVAWRAYELACDPTRTKFYAVAMPNSAAARLAAPADGPEDDPSQSAAAGLLPFTRPEEQVTAEIDAAAYLDAKVAALRAHATQIVVDEPFFEMTGLATIRALGTEYYTLLSGPGVTTAGMAGQGREADLFCGL
jgi:N-acetyl-1-D-myo-inositol-2-amino-2-deoxy-alpha-D-glucopyranoside deacetylase